HGGVEALRTVQALGHGEPHGDQVWIETGVGDHDGPERALGGRRTRRAALWAGAGPRGRGGWAGRAGHHRPHPAKRDPAPGAAEPSLAARALRWRRSASTPRPVILHSSSSSAGDSAGGPILPMTPKRRDRGIRRTTGISGPRLPGRLSRPRDEYQSGIASY